MLTVFLADCILFFQAEDGIRDGHVTGVQTCALPIWADGDDALALVAAGEIDVLLLDLRMPRRDGIAVLEAMRERGLTVPVLVLTTFDDDDLVLRALRAGARGYLLKDVTLDQLVAAIMTLAGGGTLLQPGLTDRLFRAAETNSSRKEECRVVTDRSGGMNQV